MTLSDKPLSYPISLVLQVMPDAEFMVAGILQGNASDFNVFAAKKQLQLQH